MSRSKVVIQQVVSLDGEITVEAKEDVSEAPSNGDDSSLEISIKNGKAHNCEDTAQSDMDIKLGQN